MRGPFIAVDWGSTNRRAYRVAAGSAVPAQRDARGILALRPEEFAPEAAALRGEGSGLPLLCAGMVGSWRGWREVPYVSSPASLAQLAAGTVWVEPGRAAIVPGVSFRSAGRCDVMRGEEIQFLGAAYAGLAPDGELLCQPGTHAKWTRIRDGQIGEFSTALTGELYSMLRAQSLLKEVLTGEVAPHAAFCEGVHEGSRQTLLTSLFGARAAQLLSARPPAEGASYVSGMLIGSDVHSHLRGARDVYVIGEAPLAPLYGAAIGHLGARAHYIDSGTAFLAGAIRLWELLA